MPKVFHEYNATTITLDDLIRKLPQCPDTYDFGSDINEANVALLSPNTPVPQKAMTFFRWCARFQPCLFGRMSAGDLKGMSFDICWITDEDIATGDSFVRRKIQKARRTWKDRAEIGESHGFLVMFNVRRLVFAKPGTELLEVCRHISDLYFVEHAPTEVDVIYTEAMPLRDGSGKMVVFKAGANIFYPTAHLTRNHDRRVPGGLLISINSPGHYLNSLVTRGLVPAFSQAVEYVRNLALRSIGNGGIGDKGMHSLTWHNRDPEGSQFHCPVKNLPSYVPADFSREHYSGLYHTDVLVPTAVTIDGQRINHLNGDYSNCEVWSHLRIDYLVETRFDEKSQNYALFHGHPIPEVAKYHNPWPPARPVNAPGKAYGEKIYE
ncbi:MAG TPA: hypothetical protein VG759_28105 [Candidatus Angelobacter sp.]|jgi:hypothetical protein|nr:hypothetical protein [Candidatus Angelobacter sp.]